MAHKVKLQIRGLQPYRVILRHRISTQEIPQPCQQFRNGEWLREVVVSATFQPLHSIIDGAASGQDQYGSETTLGATTRNQIQSIHVGKTEINDKGIVAALQCLEFSRLSVAGRVDLIPSLTECPFKESLNSHIIFYQEQSHRSISTFLKTLHPNAACGEAL